MNSDILIYQDENILYLKFQGDIRYTDTHGFDELIDKIEKEKSSRKEIIMNFDDTESIDSTNLGLIAKLGSYYMESFSKKINIITANNDIIRLFDSMGFEQIAEISDSRTNNKEFKCNVVLTGKSDICPETILKAHEELLKLDPEKNGRFQTIVDYLRKDIIK